MVLKRIAILMLLSASVLAYAMAVEIWYLAKTNTNLASTLVLDGSKVNPVAASIFVGFILLAFCNAFIARANQYSDNIFSYSNKKI